MILKNDYTDKWPQGNLNPSKYERSYKVHVGTLWMFVFC